MLRFNSTVRDGGGFDGALVMMALVYLVAFSAFPLVYNLVISFQSVDLFTIATFDRPFAGFQNYREIVDDPLFWPIVRNTFIFVLLSVGGQLGIGFALALFFRMDFPGSTWLRGLFLAGWIMPGLVVGAIWGWILAGDFGVLNWLLQSLGLSSQRIFWLSDPTISLYSVIIANIWLGTSFNMILLSVGLSGISKDLYEAAELDGADVWQRFWTITLPMMRSTIGAIVSLGLIFTLQQFDLFAAITSGGPNNSSNVAQYWAWDLSFRQYDFARGATISVIMIIFVMLASVVYVRSTRQEIRG